MSSPSTFLAPSATIFLTPGRSINAPESCLRLDRKRGFRFRPCWSLPCSRKQVSGLPGAACSKIHFSFAVSPGFSQTCKIRVRTGLLPAHKRRGPAQFFSSNNRRHQHSKTVAPSCDSILSRTSNKAEVPVRGDEHVCLVLLGRLPFPAQHRWWRWINESAATSGAYKPQQKESNADSPFSLGRWAQNVSLLNFASTLLVEPSVYKWWMGVDQRGAVIEHAGWQTFQSLFIGDP